ncbi:MAG: HAD family hydrolase [Deltaproteobacteria bacterium]|jgi:phosphoglycolate phosphatase|nr:HAD family hydrolase [Deltaproteobacteria bacterium]
MPSPPSGGGRGPGKDGAPAAIFDLDGTLLDTLPDLHGSLNRALAAFGLPTHTLDGVRAMVGNGIARLVRDAAPADRRGEGFLGELKAAFKRDYASRQLELTRPYPGVRELLDGLAGMGWPMAVLSNKDDDNSKAVVGHFFPGVFAAVLGASPSRRPKPDTGGALEAAGILGRAPGDVFYLGDGENDMKVAAECGFVPVGVGWGFRSAAQVRAAGAKAVIERPGEFLGLWEGLRAPSTS